MAEEQRPQSTAATRAVESAPQAGDRMIRIGGLIAAVGVVASLFALLPLITDVQAAWWLWFVAIGGVSIGVGMALWGMVRAARARTRYLAPGD